MHRIANCARRYHERLAASVRGVEAVSGRAFRNSKTVRVAVIESRAGDTYIIWELYLAPPPSLFPCTAGRAICASHR